MVIAGADSGTTVTSRCESDTLTIVLYQSQVQLNYNNKDNEKSAQRDANTARWL